MKKNILYFIFFIALGTTLVACDENDEKEITVTPEFLAGTIWKGSLKESNDSSKEIVISFMNKEKGTFKIVNVNYGGYFTYKINSNNIEINTELEDTFNYFHGIWWVEKVDEDSLVLFSNIGTEGRKTITLTKTFNDNKE